MQQLEFDLRPSLSVQLTLPFDYSKCGRQADLLTTSCGPGRYLVLNGSSAVWSKSEISLSSTLTANEITTDVLVVKSPVRSFLLSLKSLFKKTS